MYSQLIMVVNHSLLKRKMLLKITAESLQTQTYSQADKLTLNHCFPQNLLAHYFFSHLPKV